MEGNNSYFLFSHSATSFQVEGRGTPITAVYTTRTVTAEQWDSFRTSWIFYKRAPIKALCTIHVNPATVKEE